jgi:hypothetical protein
MATKRKKPAPQKYRQSGSDDDVETKKSKQMTKAG